MQSGLPVTEFAELRRTAPVWWNAQKPGTGGFTDGGFWAISKHEDIKAISRDNDNWSTNENGVVISFFDGMDPSVIDSTKALLINHDPPEHTRLRKLVSKLFTPRGVNELDSKLRGAAYSSPRKPAPRAAAISSRTSRPNCRCSLCRSDRRADRRSRDVLRLGQLLYQLHRSRRANRRPGNSERQPARYAYAMAEDRRKNPGDDIVTMLVQADLDGVSG